MPPRRNLQTGSGMIWRQKGIGHDQCIMVRLLAPRAAVSEPLLDAAWAKCHVGAVSALPLLCDVGRGTGRKRALVASFVSQRVDGVEFGCPARWIVAEHDPHSGSEEEAHDVNRGIEDEGYVDDARKPQGGDETQRDPHEPAESAKHHGLGQELQPDLARQRADCEANADLAGALSD